MTQEPDVVPAEARLFSRVMLAVDDSDAGLRAAEYARTLFAGRASIKVTTVAENPRTLFPLGSAAQGFLTAARDEIASDARAVLGKVEAMFPDDRLESELIDLSRHTGDMAHAILHAASQWHAELIVMGERHHQGLLRWIEGTVSEPVTRGAGCSLLLVPENSRVSTGTYPERIVLAIDGSASSLAALRTGVQLAKPGTKLRVVYVVDRAAHLMQRAAVDVLERVWLDEGREVLERAERTCADAGHPVETAMLTTNTARDDIPHAIVRDVDEWNGDLLILGTHGRRGLARWFLGSVAARTLRLATTPVLLVRGPKSPASSGC